MKFKNNKKRKKRSPFAACKIKQIEVAASASFKNNAQCLLSEPVNTYFIFGLSNQVMYPMPVL